jgi:uncharacterized protein YqeY
VQDKIDNDLKQAMLAGDKTKAETLRTLKSALQNEAIAQGARDSGLADAQAIKVLQREAKKRQEAAELYNRGGSEERADAELDEKTVIDSYLPEQISEEELAKMVDEQITATGAAGLQDMGKVIGAVKAKAGGAADGAVIAKLVKEKLNP